MDAEAGQARWVYIHHRGDTKSIGPFGKCAQLCKMMEKSIKIAKKNISFIVLTYLEQVFIGLPSFPWTKKYQAWIELGEEVPSPLDDAYSKEALGGGWAQAFG